jgi:hypothetical protein
MKKYIRGATDLSNEKLESLINWINLSKKATVWSFNVESVNYKDTSIAEKVDV